MTRTSIGVGISVGLECLELPSWVRVMAREKTVRYPNTIAQAVDDNVVHVLLDEEKIAQ
jgi:hypothetical protein